MNIRVIAASALALAVLASAAGAATRHRDPVRFERQIKTSSCQTLEGGSLDKSPYLCKASDGAGKVIHLVPKRTHHTPTAFMSMTANQDSHNEM